MVRWDYDNDGAWDTEFVPADRRNDYRPRLIPWPYWVVSCEVMDISGATAVRIDSLDLRPLAPAPPDLAIHSIEAIDFDFSVGPDTLVAGKTGFLNWDMVCWIDDDVGDVRSVLLVDGEFVREQYSTCAYASGRCEVTGGIMTSFSNPGHYEITVILDFDDTVMESNEANNEMTLELVVVEAP